MPTPPTPRPAPRQQAGCYIYLAGPWAPMGGGMFRVAQYLIQAQHAPQAQQHAPHASLNASRSASEHAPQHTPHAPHSALPLRPLDTRGGAGALYSFWVLATALARLVRGRLSGQLAGVHVNMAERLSLFRKSAVILTCRALGIPVVLHLHAAQFEPFYRQLPRPLQRLTRWVFSLPASCIVLGSAAQRFVTQELRVPPSRVEIIFNGVPEPTHPRRQPGQAQARQVLFVGNLSERKGVSDLLQALALPGLAHGGPANPSPAHPGQAQAHPRLADSPPAHPPADGPTNSCPADALAPPAQAKPPLQVTLAGGGDVRAYQAQARQLGIDGFVHFTGWTDQAQVARLMAQADVLVLPSYDEGLPLVILEALANAVAVICSPVGEIPTVLQDGVNACFVQPGDVAGIAAALQRVLHEPALRQSLERNGRALYEQQFSLARFAASVAAIHQRHFCPGHTPPSQAGARAPEASP